MGKPSVSLFSLALIWHRIAPLSSMGLHAGRVWSGVNRTKFVKQNRILVEMVTIRLARGGSKKRPFYHLTVTDSRNSRDGRFIERVGFLTRLLAARKSVCALIVNALRSGWAKVPRPAIALHSCSRLLSNCTLPPGFGRHDTAFFAGNCDRPDHLGVWGQGLA